MKLIHRKRYKKIHSLLSFSHKKSYIFQEKNYLVLKNGIQIIVTELSLGYLARIKIGDLNCHIYHFAVFPPKITKYQNPVLNNAELFGEYHRDKFSSVRFALFHIQSFRAKGRHGRITLYFIIYVMYNI